MMIEKNKSLPVFDILHLSFTNLLAKIKYIFLASYGTAFSIYMIVMILPSPVNMTSEASLLIRISYDVIFLSLLLIISTLLYRLLSFDICNIRNLVPKKPGTTIVKMFLYLIALAFLLFVATLAVSLFFLLVAAIVNNVTETSALNETNLPPVVYFSMMIAILLIIMRLQPTFISIATERTLIEMKSSYYYTRDNFKELILIGLFSFAPAMLPVLIVYYAIESSTGVAITNAFLTFLMFPLFLLPYLSLLSAGIEVDKFLVQEQASNKMEPKL